jgi:hypothetical protein
MQEDRAWIDKPFYTLKRAVVLSLMTLPHVLNNLDEKIQFVFQTFSADVTKKTISTMDYVMGYGDKVHTFQLNAYRRGTYKNWFVGGYSKENLDRYLEFILRHFQQFAPQPQAV